MIPSSIENEEQLDALLSEPSPGVIDTLAKLDGDVLILGVAGKMGPTLARMARRASEAAGVRRKVIGVARFSDADQQAKLQEHGVETIRCDLLDPDQLERLPDARNIIYMVGRKFGSTGSEWLTWATNVLVPATVCGRFRHSRMVAFSTGNVYDLTSASGGGSRETDPLSPRGEYAWTAVGRERVFEHFSRSLGIPVSMLRLNYACELRYGVLVDLARQVLEGKNIDLTMGYFNTIWQGDANALALESLGHAATPPFVLNLTGPETLSVRQVAEEFGRLFQRPARFKGQESPDALLSNTEQAQRLLGPRRVGVPQLMEWIADWLRRGGPTMEKPTHFQVRDGRF